MYAPIQDCWFLTGPTASGKTRVGLALAERLNAEIISLDSMSIYRDMDIGTAKPSVAEQAVVPHHLLDIVDADEEFSLANYLQAAHRVAAEIHDRGKQVLFVGGTPLYLKALLRGLDEGPPADWEFRKSVREEAERLGIGVLHERLRQVDPLAADKLPPGDVRRIIRALEVYKHTGKPLSHLQLHFEEGVPANDCRVFALSWDKSALHERIERRVERMFEIGLLDEIRHLRRKFGALSRTASQAVGYREGIEYLSGACDLMSAQERVKLRTRRFAKRQGTWFRGLCECRFVDLAGDPPPEETAAAILDQVS